MSFDVRDELRWQTQLLYRILHNQEKIMDQLNALNTNINTLSATADSIIAAIAALKTAAGVDPAAVQQAADAVAAINTKLTAALS